MQRSAASGLGLYASNRNSTTIIPGLITPLSSTKMQNIQHLLPSLPQDAPFEIRLSPGKGLGAFATKDIEATSCVLREEPLFVILKPESAINVNDVETAFSSLTKAQKQQFLRMGVSANRSFVSKFDTFMRNRFNVGKSLDVEPDGQGMYLLCTRFNHSCVPNAATIIGSPPSILKYDQAIYAIKHIARGEEIAITYDASFDYLTTEMRRSSGLWDFVCNCRACNVTDPFHHVSDMRRALLRGLYYLLTGVDPAGCKGRKIPVTREAEKGKLSPEIWHLVKMESKHAEKIMMWSTLAGYAAEAEGLAFRASEHFKNAVAAVWHLSGADPVAGMQEADWSNAVLLAYKSQAAIRSCRPADHADVMNREQLLTQVLGIPLCPPQK